MNGLSEGESSEVVPPCVDEAHTSTMLFSDVRLAQSFLQMIDTIEKGFLVAAWPEWYKFIELGIACETEDGRHIVLTELGSRVIAALRARKAEEK